MTRRGATLSVLILSLILVAPPASADNTVSASDDGQRIDLKVEPLRNQAGVINGAECHATNHRVPTQNAAFILVSVVCQYRDGTGVWRNLGPPQSVSNEDSSTSGSAHHASNACVDAGTNGNHPLRARGDGYWIGYNGQRHDFRDSGALFTTSPYLVAICRPV